SRPGKFHLLAFFLWITPLLIGYFYSQKSPVLQNSVLLFSFPFLLMLMFAWIPPLEKWKWSPVIPGSFAIILLIYVTFYKPFHLTDHFGRLRELVATAVETQEKYSKDAVDVFFNVDIAYFLEYNELSIGKYPKNVLGTINSGNAELSEFRNMVENSAADYFVYGWSTRYSPLEILPIIREKFPFLIEKKEWFNSAVYVFCKYKSAEPIDEKKDILFCSRDTFGSPGVFMQADTVDIKPVSGWTAPCKLVWSDTLNPMRRKVIRGGNWKDFIWRQQYARLDSTCIYSPSLKMKVGDMLKNPDNQLLFTTHLQMLDTNTNIVLVIEFQRDGKQLYWNGRESIGQIDHSDWHQWQNAYFGLQLPKDLRLTDTINFYCYSKNSLPVLIDYLDVKTLKGHQGIYGPRADLK
ncbi:MAG TPA: hypothetical protein VFJ43_11955, partial [Bacteroidia bacterium]|nr:hypothetical protein [Bacteroidia bacterium]